MSSWGNHWCQSALHSGLTHLQEVRKQAGQQAITADPSHPGHSLLQLLPCYGVPEETLPVKQKIWAHEEAVMKDHIQHLAQESIQLQVCRLSWSGFWQLLSEEFRPLEIKLKHAVFLFSAGQSEKQQDLLFPSPSHMTCSINLKKKNIYTSAFCFCEQTQYKLRPTLLIPCRDRVTAAELRDQMHR